LVRFIQKVLTWLGLVTYYVLFFHHLESRRVSLAGITRLILSRRGPDTDLKRWGLHLAKPGGKRGKKRAVVAVARKLGILLHRLG
jgi:hypothetical protein